ncbi:hypothetical protein [Paenibacillus dakarensis]|uniref:hypothetical protein n=1 Tax=Paenibacillus dakarensis TaxID=1527293 RepID=UPI0006D5528E|nr:hypothetical protein [Paenibacillus dakarensis]
MNVMTVAWKIARRGATIFGGSAKDYFAEALKQAWTNIKAAKARVTFELAADTRKTRTWLAQIVGTHPVYKLERKFLNADYANEDGDKVFRLNNGFYEYNNGRGRAIIEVANGEYRVVEQSDVLAAIA